MRTASVVGSVKFNLAKQEIERSTGSFEISFNSWEAL
jgi:hypothetical protein